MVKLLCYVSYLYQSLLRIKLGFTDGTRQLVDSLQSNLTGRVEKGILENLPLLCANGQSDSKTTRENNLLQLHLQVHL